MKRLFTLLLCSILLGFNTLNAQIIKGDFDLPWVEDIKGNGALPGQYIRPGLQPVGWEASNVNQKVLMEKKEVLVTSDENRDGSDGFSVRMENKFVGLGTIGSNAPAYLTLGTPWVYAVMDIPSCDGGTLGGIEYTERPDSIIGYFKRTLGEDKDEKALIRAYSWTGTATSKVPANIAGGLTATDTVEVKDQDRYILESKGGAKLVGKAEYRIEGELTEWTRIAVPFEYANNDAPQKLNIILSSANYEDRSAIGGGNILWADDVQLVSNAKLKSLTIDGLSLQGFNEDIFEYQLPYSEKDKELKAVAWGGTATILEGITNISNGVVKKITVTCNDAKGKKEYVYTVTFKGEKNTISLPADKPSFTYGDDVTSLGFSSSSNAAYTYTSSNERVIRYNEKTGSLEIVGVGTTEITANQAGNDAYAATISQPLTVTVKPAILTVSLAEGAWVERGVNVSETTKNSGNCSYKFVYEGFKNGEKAEDILTKAVTITAPASKTPEKVGSTREAVLSGGQAKNYELKYASNQTFTITKTRLDVYVTYNNVRFNSGYDDRKYHEVGTPVGKEPQEFHLSYFNFKYSEDEEVLGTNLPTVVCSVKKDSELGSKHTVTLQFPETEPENYTWNSKLPDDAAVIVRKGIVFKYAPVEDKTYGDSKFSLNVAVEVADGEDPVAVQYKSLQSAIASVGSNTGEVTIKKAGTAQITAYTQDTEVYASAEMTIEFEVDKAPLTITAQDTARKVGEKNPVFKLLYDGLKNNDKETTSGLFITKPTIVCDADEDSPIGTYDIEVVGGEATNYYLIPAKGTLTVEAASGTENSYITNVKLFTRDGVLYIQNNLSGEKVSLYDIQGRPAGSYTDTDITVRNLKKGQIYLVKIGKTTQKIVLK